MLGHEMVVTADWLEANWEKPEVIVVHVSKDRESYDRGHIPGSQSAAWSEVAAERDGIPNEPPPLSELVSLVQTLGIGERSRVILYDDDAGLQAGRAYVAFDYLG